MGKRKIESKPDESPQPSETPPKTKKSFEKQPTATMKENPQEPKARKFPKKKVELTEKPEDWNKFKKERKELKIKRKQTKGGFDVIVQAKQIGEKLRCKTLKEGETERVKLINQLHSLLRDQGHYAKFVLAHDTSRVVQWLLKYSSELVKAHISKELIPVTVDMLQSKYGIFCIKRLLKYGSSATKTAIVSKLYGHAVKLTSHTISAPVFEYAYSTCATPLQKSHLCQEFFGDMYKNSKDDSIKHLSDAFATSPALKAAILSSTKANLLRVINKNLLDSALIQTVLHQYLAVCSDDDRNELIQLLTPHIVVIGNSKDGARAAMHCIWHGSNKDRKQAMKTIKSHVIDMCRHEHGHCTIIALLDAADDTVLLQKIVLGEVLKAAKDLARNEWGRKVLMWLVAPADPKCFHPKFVGEIEAGRSASSAKKAPELRRKEILACCQPTLFALIEAEPRFWLENSSMAFLMLAIVKSAENSEDVAGVLAKLAEVVVDGEWRVKLNGKEESIAGIEEAGLHLVMKKLLANDAELKSEVRFGGRVAERLDEEVLGRWVGCNRACFVLVGIYESIDEEGKEALKQKLEGCVKALKKQKTAGSRILLEKIK